MPRTKPTKKLGVYGSFDINPENAIGSYIESKQQEKLYIKPPVWDISRDGLELFSIQNERDHHEMANLQKEMLENANKQKTINIRRIKDMYRIQKELRDQFISVNSFIRDCDEKKRVAEKKITEERLIHEQLEEHTEKLTKDISELEQFENILTQTVKELEPYEKVIQEVVEKSDIFKSVNDCMVRCDALMLAQVEITELEQEKIKAIEEMRRAMVKAMNEASLKILGLNNELSEMERSYNLAKAESMKWEKIMAATKDYIAGNELTRNRILDAIQQMYYLLCKRNGTDCTASRDDIETMLDYIKNEIEILQEVVILCNKEMSKPQSQQQQQQQEDIPPMNISQKRPKKKKSTGPRIRITE